MRAAVLALLAVLCSGCAGLVQRDPGNLPPVPEVVVNASGEGDAQGVWAGTPLTARFRWRGVGQIRLRSTAPFLVFDGDSAFVVEPLPFEAAAGQRDVATGAVVVLRGGVRGLLNPPGSVEAGRAPLPTSEPQGVWPSAQP